CLKLLHDCLQPFALFGSLQKVGGSCKKVLLHLGQRIRGCGLKGKPITLWRKRTQIQNDEQKQNCRSKEEISWNETGIQLDGIDFCNICGGSCDLQIDPVGTSRIADKPVRRRKFILEL